VLALGYSFTDKNLLAPHTSYVGLANYHELLSDDVFKQSVKVTAIMTGLLVLLPNALGLGIALMLSTESRLSAVLRNDLLRADRPRRGCRQLHLAGDAD